jgi:HEPN domain-containing protein
MKKRKDSLYPQDWLRVAERDWERVQKRLIDEDHEDAGFRLPQALEKYLKAFLLAHGWELEKTHETTTLLEEAIKYKPELGAFTGLCKRVEDYYFAERYPSTLDTGVSFDEVAKDFEAAQQLREMILETFAKKPEATAEEQNSSRSAKQLASSDGQDKISS